MLTWGEIKKLYILCKRRATKKKETCDRMEVVSVFLFSYNCKKPQFNFSSINIMDCIRKCFFGGV